MVLRRCLVKTNVINSSSDTCLWELSHINESILTWRRSPESEGRYSNSFIKHQNIPSTSGLQHSQNHAQGNRFTISILEVKAWISKEPFELGPESHVKMVLKHISVRRVIGHTYISPVWWMNMVWEPADNASATSKCQVWRHSIPRSDCS